MVAAVQRPYVTRPNSRDDILDAALRLVRREGSGRLTIDAVARESGLSKGGVLYNFPTRDALVLGMDEAMRERFEEAVDRHRERLADSPNPLLGAVIAAWRERRGEEREVIAVVVAAAAENPTVLKSLRDRLESYRKRIQAEASDPIEATILWLATGALMLYGALGILDLSEPFSVDLDEALQLRAAAV